jgi:hypothetical protein
LVITHLLDVPGLAPKLRKSGNPPKLTYPTARRREMSLWSFKVNGDLWTGIAIGVCLVAAPVVLPFLGSAARVLLKEIVTGIFIIVEDVQTTAERVVSATSELIDEAEYEVRGVID